MRELDVNSLVSTFKANRIKRAEAGQLTKSADRASPEDIARGFIPGINLPGVNAQRNVYNGPNGPISSPTHNANNKPIGPQTVTQPYMFGMRMGDMYGQDNEKPGPAHTGTTWGGTGIGALTGGTAGGMWSQGLSNRDFTRDWKADPRFAELHALAAEKERIGHPWINALMRRDRKPMDPTNAALLHNAETRQLALTDPVGQDDSGNPVVSPETLRQAVGFQTNDALRKKFDLSKSPIPGRSAYDPNMVAAYPSHTSLQDDSTAQFLPTDFLKNDKGARPVPPSNVNNGIMADWFNPSGPNNKYPLHQNGAYPWPKRPLPPSSVRVNVLKAPAPKDPTLGQRLLSNNRGQTIPTTVRQGRQNSIARAGRESLKYILAGSLLGGVAGYGTSTPANGKGPNEGAWRKLPPGTDNPFNPRTAVVPPPPQLPDQSVPPAKP